MNSQFSNPHETETSGSSVAKRRVELLDQHWNREKSEALADAEGLVLSDRHWDVVLFLRKYYLKHGLPINARTTAKAMNQHFSDKGGSSYLRQLFAQGPVAQGSRLANVRIPALAIDRSFGTSY